MGKDAPDAPDLRPQAEASEYAADKAFEISENQLAWAKEQFAASSELLAPLLKQQFDIAGEQQSNAKRDRARWEKKYQPLEDQFLDQVADYNTQERQTLDAGRAKAGVQQALDAQRQNAQQSLNAYGIDPSQTRSQAVEAAQRTQGALAQASAGNTARNRVEDVGRALLSDASNMGRGLPGQAAASYAGAINAGNSGMGNQNNTTGQFMGALGNAGQWHGQGMGGLQQGANIRNIGYQNQLGEFNSGGGALGALGQLGGMAMGAWAGTRGGAEGGEVPDDLAPTPQPGDTIPTMLKKGEYVVPEEVVRAKGTDFFDKMREKYLGIPMEEGPKKQYPIPARGMAEGGLVTDIQMRTE